MSNMPHSRPSADNRDPSGSRDLLPLVYQELRRLASARLAHEKPGQTLQATALVHEAYLRVVGGDSEKKWDSRGHFFAAAAEAMRRILIERARQKKQRRRGGEWRRVDFDVDDAASTVTSEELLSIDDALCGLEVHDPEAAQVFKLRYFAGCSVEDASELMGTSRATAFRQWSFARAWLLSRLFPEQLENS